MNVKIYEPSLGENYQDPFWYQDIVIAVVTDGKRKGFLEAVGDIRWQGEDRIIYGPDDLTQEEFNMGDKFLSELPADGWIYNNWFEGFYYFDNEFIDSSYDVCYNYNEAIEGIKIFVHDNSNDFWEE